MKIINLGCGNNPMEGCINIDVFPYPTVDKVMDLSKYQWDFANESIDGIYASHVIEHLKDQEMFIKECYRILKPGGFLRLNLPHSSCAACIGCMGHYRTYSYGTMTAYLSNDFYMFGTKKFKTIEQRLNWWYEKGDQAGLVPKPILLIIKIMNPIINWVANLNPQICENFWCFWVGGFREVIWKGIKI